MAHCQPNDGIGEQILPNAINTRPPRIKHPPPSHPFQFPSTSQQNTHHTRRQIRPTHDIYPTRQGNHQKDHHQKTLTIKTKTLTITPTHSLLIFERHHDPQDLHPFPTSSSSAISVCTS